MLTRPYDVVCLGTIWHLPFRRHFPYYRIGDGGHSPGIAPQYLRQRCVKSDDREASAITGLSNEVILAGLI